MHLGCSNLLYLFDLSRISWKFCHGSDEFVSVFVGKRASFYNNLPLTSVCYQSKIKNTNKRRCVAQCLTHHDVCNGILFNKEHQTCKLIDCYPSDAFPGLGFDTGWWDLFWKTTGMCKAGWLKHEGHCYFFNQTGATWTNAKKCCEDNGGSLAYIRSSEENSWIADSFLPPWDSALCSANDWWKCCGYWIGGNDLAVEGTFLWTSDNSSLGFVNWYPNQPDDLNSNEDCLSMCRNKRWNDDHCDQYNPYICKTPAL